MKQKFRIYGLVATILGILAIPLGYIILPIYIRATAIRMPDGKLAVTEFSSGAWIVVSSFFLALFFFIVGLILLIKSRKQNAPME